MNKEDVVKTLFELDGIEPGVTSLAWNQLEEEKPEIFKDFYAKLILEESSSTSNQLLEQQKDLENFLACLDDPLHFIEEDFQHIPGTSWSPSAGQMKLRTSTKHMQFPCNFQFLSHAPEVRVLSFFLQLTFYPGETPFR
ncbi:uncharacterized protein [Populus alba]|uniref:uncharacterized protein n=1 Tax=Populus alba TaxID=43335 RepID=UPI003CC72A79